MVSKTITHNADRQTDLVQIQGRGISTLIAERFGPEGLCQVHAVLKTRCLNEAVFVCNAWPVNNPLIVIYT